MTKYVSFCSISGGADCPTREAGSRKHMINHYLQVSSEGSMALRRKQIRYNNEHPDEIILKFCSNW